jgi:hypothetical protein
MKNKKALKIQEQPKDVIAKQVREAQVSREHNGHRKPNYDFEKDPLLSKGVKEQMRLMKKEQKEQKPSGGRELFGQSMVSVIRFLGANGLNVREADAALKSKGVNAAAGTLARQIYLGKSKQKEYPPADVPESDAKELLKFKGSIAKPEKAEKPKKEKPKSKPEPKKVAKKATAKKSTPKKVKVPAVAAEATVPPVKDEPVQVG